MRQMQHYVIFPNHDNGMRLYQELKKQGTSAVISPTPRTVSKCCGLSLMIEEKDVEAVEKCASDHGIEILQIAAVEKDLNPRRDRYC